MKWFRQCALVIILSLGVCGFADAVPVTSPKDFFGFNMGDDYCLANYKQLAGYWAKLESESDRIKLVRIGKTEEGRDQLMAIVTSAANHRKLIRYQDISRRLAQAEGVNDAEAMKRLKPRYGVNN